MPGLHSPAQPQRCLHAGPTCQALSHQTDFPATLLLPVGMWPGRPDGCLRRLGRGWCTMALNTGGAVALQPWDWGSLSQIHLCHPTPVPGRHRSREEWVSLPQAHRDPELSQHTTTLGWGQMPVAVMRGHGCKWPLMSPLVWSCVSWVEPLLVPGLGGIPAPCE